MRQFSIIKLIALASSSSDDISVIMDSKKSQKLALILPLFEINSVVEELEFVLVSIFVEDAVFPNDGLL